MNEKEMIVTNPPDFLREGVPVRLAPPPAPLRQPRPRHRACDTSGCETAPVAEKSERTMNRTAVLRALVPALVIALAGCAVGRNYKRPHDPRRNPSRAGQNTAASRCRRYGGMYSTMRQLNELEDQAQGVEPEPACRRGRVVQARRDPRGIVEAQYFPT